MRYAIWDKTSAVICPNGKVFTAEEWKEMYPVAKLDNIKVVCAAGEINGGYFGTLGQMVQSYEDMGADFSQAETDIEKLAIIEEFENEMNTPKETITPEERIAAALEFQTLTSLPDAEEEE